MKTSIYPLFILLGLLLNSFCKESTIKKENEEKKQSVPILLKFSRPHQTYFQDVDRPNYYANDVYFLLDALRPKSDKVCELLWSGKTMSPDVVHSFLRPDIFTREPFKSWSHPIPKLIAGCWNFIKLNDTRPDLDFQLVKHYFPDKKKECFSVGLMQPYWMHAILDCEKLTFVDIDWRIHDTHSQILRLFRGKEMNSEPQIRESITNLNVGWVARFDGKPMVRQEKVTLDTLCFPKFQKYCLGYMQEFQKKHGNLLSVDMQVSSLHDAEYAFLPDTIPVLFLSNAIESLYTSRAQFQQILDGVAGGLGSGRQAIFIHHAAGQSEFGIYEMKTLEKEFEIHTLCKDKYDSSPVGETHVYETHFEKVTRTKSPPTCSGMEILKKFR